MEERNPGSTLQCLPLESAPIFREREQLLVTRPDKIAAWLTVLLGFWFAYTFTSSDTPWKLAVFTVAYIAVVAGYFRMKNLKMTQESFFWMVILACLGFGFKLEGIIFPFFQVIVFILVAAYWVVSAGGNLMEEGRSSRWIIADGWNTMIIIPFYNFLCHIKVLIFHEKGQKRNALRSVGAVFLGLAITVPILVIALPLLGNADQQFADLLQGFGNIFRWNYQVTAFETMIRIILALPVTAYLFGLFFGSLNRRNTNRLSRVSMHETVGALRIVPNLAVYTVAAVVCCVYILFIALQGSYIFSAFLGAHPENYTYAEYARQGFFELCKVSVLNLIILLGVNTLGKDTYEENKVLKAMNIVLSALTILLIATAMSKMLLYISAYGLTEKRLLTMVFMLWLLLVFGQMIILQFRRIAFIRISFIAGVILYTMLCVSPVIDWISMFNLFLNYA